MCPLRSGWAASPSPCLRRPRSRSRRLALSSIPRVSLYRLSKPPTGTTRVYGDPAQPGMYVSRVALRPNAKNRPHYNDQDQIVTVLKGTWWVGKGEVFRQDRLVAVREGGLMYLPAKLAYYDVAGSGDVILQITGVGPVQSTHAELDAAGKPVAGRRSISRGHARRRRPAPPLRVGSSGCEQSGPRQSGPGAGDADTTAGSGQSGPTAGDADATAEIAICIDRLKIGGL